MAKKKTTKRAASKATAVKSGGTGDDPKQTYLDSVAVPKNAKLEFAIAKYEESLAANKASREELEERRSRLIVDFEAAGYQQYRFGGRVYFLEDGGLMVKRRKAKDK